MLDLIRPIALRSKCDGTSRREFMQIGTLGMLGLTLPNLLQARAAAGTEAKKPPAIILLFLDGGASQEETWDPKPDAPKEYRCLFGLTKTRLPGVQFCDFFTRM